MRYFQGISRFLGTAAIALLASGMVIASLAMSAAWASDLEEVCNVFYSDFEENVPHVDLSECPDVAGLRDTEDGFCRLGIHGAEGTVYVFEFLEDGEGCLVQAQSASMRDILPR